LNALAASSSPGEKAGEGLLVFAPLRLEALAIRPAVPGATLVRTGMGPGRARDAAASARSLPARAVAVGGCCGGLDPSLAPGEIVVADEVRGPDGAIHCSSAGVIAGMLRRRGFPVRVGPVVSSSKIVTGAERSELAADGAIAVDMETAWLAEAAEGRPFAVVRVVLDTPTHELVSLATIPGAFRAFRSLRGAAGVLAEWTAAVRPRRVLVAGPRASCAGVERAIEVVELALRRHGAPLYVRKQIVHNAHVVADLESRGVVFVDEVDEVPAGAIVVFSAHGVSPHVRALAEERELRVIDATCPLVSKVHAEVRRFADADYTVVLIGHEGHDEVEGTRGEAPERVRLVERVADAATVVVEDPERVAYLTQTTLAVDETAEVVEALRRRFPRLEGPRSNDICYATQNRQDAVKALAPECDVMLVVGSRNSSNSNRLVEVAERGGCRTYLIDDESDIEPAWLAECATVGLTAGASAPEALVQRVLAALSTLGPASVEYRSVRSEDVHFRLPPDV
jgi:4-hydroxy-3-methylbut-2-enyl diphosphate reductase